MAITNFIPELWSAALLEVWWSEVVFANLVNREYEGIATRGNTVHITGIVAPQVHDYKANNRTTSADEVSDTGVDLLIDQEKSTDFYVDDIDAAQAAGSLSAYADAAGQALVEDSDKFLANLAVANGTSLAGTLPTTGDEAFDLVGDARKALNKVNAPSGNRVFICNAEFEGLLLKASSKLTAYDTSGDTNGLRNATVGMVLGFRVVTSNNLPAINYPQFIAFDKRSIAYVSQIDQVEGMRAQDKFADRIRALHVYGGKVVRPLGVQVFNKTGS